MSSGLKLGLALGSILIDASKELLANSDIKPKAEQVKNSSKILWISGEESIQKLHPQARSILGNIQFDGIILTDSRGLEFNIQQIVPANMIQVYYLGLYPKNVVSGVYLKQVQPSKEYRDIYMKNDCSFHFGIVNDFNNKDSRPYKNHINCLSSGKHSVLFNNTTLEAIQGVPTNVGAIY